MSTEKLLSVIVPSYNMEAYLAKNISSMMVQDDALRQLVEVIVVNDGSKDRTSEIAHDFAEKYPGCITVIDKPNGHYGSCINAALPVAKGKYIRVLDADDYADTEAFESFLQYLITITETYSETIDLIISDTCQVDAEGAIKKRTNYSLPSLFELNQIAESFRDFVSLHAITYRTAMLREMGYRQTEGCAYTDNEWFILPMSRVNRATYFQRVVMCYLIGRDGQTMQPELYLKSFPIVVKLIKGIAEKSQNLKNTQSPTSSIYFDYLIQRAVGFVYSFYLFGRGIQLPQEGLIEFDKFLKNNVFDLYEQLNKILTSSSKFKFCYIAKWRKTYNRNMMILRMYRGYIHFLHFVRKIHN